MKEVKQQDDATVQLETQVKVELLTPTSVKREFDGEKISPIASKQVTAKRAVKRRRKT